MRFAVVLAAVLLTAGLCAEDRPAATPRPAAPVADLLKLAAAGLSEEVQIAWIEAQPPFAPVSADAIVQLKEAKVGPKTLEVFVRNGNDATAQRKLDALRGGEPVFVKTYEVMRLSLATSLKLTPADYERTERSDGMHSPESVVRYTYTDSSLLYPGVTYGSLPEGWPALSGYAFPYSWYRTQPTYYRGPYYPYYRPVGFTPCYPNYAPSYHAGGTGFRVGIRR